MVYFIQGEITRRIKIGFTSRDTIINRLSSIQSNCSEKLSILGIISGASVKEEHFIHKRFKESRIIGEWFIETLDLLKFIEDSTNSKVDYKSFYKTEFQSNHNLLYSHRTN